MVISFYKISPLSPLPPVPTKRRLQAGGAAEASEGDSLEQCRHSYSGRGQGAAAHGS